MDEFGLRLLAVPALMTGAFLVLVAIAKIAGAWRGRRSRA